LVYGATEALKKLEQQLSVKKIPIPSKYNVHAHGRQQQRFARFSLLYFCLRSKGGIDEL